MRRIVISLVFGCLGLLLLSQSAGAYYINDTRDYLSTITKVPVFRNGTSYLGMNADEIDTSGDSWQVSRYQTWGIDYAQLPGDTNLTIKIYTNYPSTGPGDSWGTFPGDFGIDVDKNGFYEYAIPLYGHDGLTVGGLYNVSSWRTPDTGYPGSSYRPAGDTTSYYGNANVTAYTSGVPIGLETVSWNTIGTYPSSYPYYRIDLTLDVSHFLPLPFDGDIGVYWSTATCANDVITGFIPAAHTPEPGTWFLLGTGLAGIFAFKVRKRSQSS